MEYLPIFLAVRDQPCLVVGGGDVAARKIDMLRRAGARVTVVSPRLVETLADLRQRGDIVHVAASCAVATGWHDRGNRRH